MRSEAREKSLRLFIAGQRSFGAAALDALSAMAGVEIVGVSCPTNPTDRLLLRAKHLGYSIIPSELLNAESLPAGVDLIVCAHSHSFVGRKTRLKTTLGAIGYHPSLLPLHRGRDAVYWTIRFRDKLAGGSVYWLSDTVDAGDIAAQDWCFVQPGDTPSTLWRRDLFPLGIRLLQQVVQDLQQCRIVAIPQDHALASWEPSVEREPLIRPDVPLLGNLSGYTVIREKNAIPNSEIETLRRPQ